MTDAREHVTIKQVLRKERKVVSQVRRLRDEFAHMGLYVKTLFKWVLLGGIIGVAGGVIGSLFHIGVNYATAIRGAHPWILYLMPVVVLSILCALVSILFCKGLHWTERLLDRGFRSPWVRVLAGSVLLIGMSLLTNGDYNGAGMDVIARALRGDVSGWAWLWKLLFTAVTIGCGFKGGEVVPSFFVGAAFGCFMGGLLGLPAGFAAAIGLVAVFCGAVNCPVASVLLSVELFGSAGAPYFAVACALSYLLSGYCGLYSSQTILYSKLRAEFINVRTHE